MSFENHHQDTLFSELVKTLVSHNCPLITRNDSWWMEELLLKPGKQRTDLLLWIIARLTNSFYPSDSDHDCTSTSTASSVSYKLPENEEGFFVILTCPLIVSLPFASFAGILDFLCQSAILSTDQADYTPFLQVLFNLFYRVCNKSNLINNIIFRVRWMWRSNLNIGPC